MTEQERKIKEQRLILATRKGLTGLDGKFGTILKQFGQPIIVQNGVGEDGFCLDTSYLPDFYAPTEDEEDFPTLDMDYSTTELGRIYDGLSGGLHLEIKYWSDKKELTVYYEGHLVYMEIGGNLECYVPSPNWEDKIDMLFNKAKIKENRSRITDREEIKAEFEKEKHALLERLKIKWGL